MLLAFALAAASSVAIAQSQAPRPMPPPRPATLQVTGHAQVSRPPDRVYIDIGVTTQAQTSEVATTQDAARVSAVLAAVKRASGPLVQLTTTEYSVTPSYHYPKSGGTPSIVGYSASNVVRVRLDDLSRIGRVIDAANRAGSNDVRNIRFALRDEETPRIEALREAALAAQEDARALASTLGLRIVRVLSATEPGPAEIPVYPQASAFRLSQAAAATPVEAGTIDTISTVTLTVEVAPVRR
jgi:uncharacterized protein YggE